MSSPANARSRRTRPHRGCGRRGGGMEAGRLAKQKKDALAALKKKRALTRHGLKMNAQKFQREYQLAEKHLIGMRRTAKQAGQFFVEPEQKLIFCIRISGINKISPKPRKIMQLLRLRQLHNGVFLK